MKIPHGVGAPDFIKETAVSVKNLKPSGKKGNAPTMAATAVAGRIKGVNEEMKKREKKKKKKGK